MTRFRRATRPIAGLAVVAALAGCGDGGPAVVVAEPVPPPVAGLGLQLTRIDVAALRIDWSYDPVAAGYLVTRDGYPLASIGANTLIDASVAVGYRYCYQVTGLAPSGEVVSESTVGCVTLI
jgi:hypothetical protein